MKGKESKKETKKAKADGTATKVQSEYQRGKASKSMTDPIVFKAKK